MKALNLHRTLLNQETVANSARLGSDAHKLRSDRVIWREALEAGRATNRYPTGWSGEALVGRKGDLCGNLKIARDFGRSLSAEHRKAIKAAVA